MPSYAPSRRLAVPFSLAALLLITTHAVAADAPPAPAAESDPAAAAFQEAERYKTIAEYARAADLYESAARQYPAHKAAVDALSDATLFRLVLGDITQATKNAELFEKTYGAKQPEKTVVLWLGIANTFAERDQFKDIKPLLTRVMPFVDRSAALDDKVRAHALLGRALDKLGDARGAEREFEVVRGLWREPAVALKAINGAGGEDELRRIGKALIAVGEAHYFFAEKRRAEVDAIRFPEYKGPPEQKAFMKHINTKVAEWVRDKRQAIEVAEKEYQKIIAIQPAPPPQWVIASASRVGMMWGKFVAEFRAAPIPPDWRKDGPVPGAPDLTYKDIRKLYYQSLDEASEPQRQRAKAAFKMCADSSVKYQYISDYSRHCQSWLAKNYEKEFTPIKEIVPSLRITQGGSSAMPIKREP